MSNNNQVKTITTIQNLRFQNGSSREHGGRRYLPYVFNEQVVSMLLAVLRSETAIEVSIQIIDAFVEMKRFISVNAGIFQRLDKVEQKQIETDQKFDQIFKALEDKSIKPKQGIFYNGQIFDAYVFTAYLIKSAKNSILPIDNYIDETVLQLLTKRKKKVTATIYTKNISTVLKQDLKKHKSQYPKITIREFTKAHDRFVIIDKTTVYHFGLVQLFRKTFIENIFSHNEYNKIMYSIELMHPYDGLECLESFYKLKNEYTYASDKNDKREIWIRMSGLYFSSLSITGFLRLPKGGAFAGNLGGAWINELGTKFYEEVYKPIKPLGLLSLSAPFIEFFYMVYSDTWLFARQLKRGKV